MIGSIVSILLTILDYFIKNHKTTSKNQKKLNKIVASNKHLLDEATKATIALDVQSVNEKVDSTISDVDGSDSLQQSNAIINDTLKNK